MDLLQDVRYAVRSFLQKPGVIVLILITLSLGIGANTAIFSLIDSVLFRSLPVKNSQELVRLFASDLDGKFSRSSSSFPVYTDYRDQSKSFTALAAYSDWNTLHVSLEGRKAERITGAVVTGNFFQVIGVQASHGRVLFPSDDVTPGGHPVVVLSDQFWNRMYEKDLRALNSQLRINGTVFTIVGILPRSFYGVGLDSIPELWLPMSMIHQASPEFPLELQLYERRLSWVDMIGRLKPGVTMEQAQAELQNIAKHRAASQPEGKKDPSVVLASAVDTAINYGDEGKATKLSWILSGVVFLVLMIACAVVAGLLLVRAEQRQREIGIRLAIGASRSRLIRQLLVESLLLALVSAAGGILFATWIIDFLVRTAPAEFPIPLEVVSPVLNFRVLLFALSAAIFSGIIFGLAPALHGSRVQLVSSLKNEVLRLPGSNKWTLRSLLIPVQICISVVLLVGAGLLLRTLWKAGSIDPGFKADHALVGSLDLARQGYKEADGQVVFRNILERIQSIPGVRSAGLARTIPVQNSGMIMSVEIPGYQPPPGKFNYVDLNIVSPEYFHALGIRILSGRNFNANDTKTSQPVVIVSETMAKRFWPSGEAVGKIIKGAEMENGDPTIIGIAQDVHYRSLKEPPESVIYMVHPQSYMSSMSLLIRTDVDEELVMPQVFAAIQSQNRDLPFFQVLTLKDKLGLSLAQERVVAGLLTSFGALALFLAVTGLYCLMSYNTQIRTRELGVRMAMGAKRRDLFRLVIDQGMRLAILGVLAGIAIALISTKALSGLLFEIKESDPVTFLVIGSLLLVSALLACLIPGRRAASLNPMEALRYE